MLDHRSSSVTKLHSHKYEYSASELLDSNGHEKENSNSSANKTEETTPEQQNSSGDNSQQQPEQNGGYVWRLSSGLVNSTTGVISGAFGLGFGGVKWVASKGYSAGEVVVDTTKNIVCKVPVPALKRKDKKE